MCQSHIPSAGPVSSSRTSRPIALIHSCPLLRHLPAHRRGPAQPQSSGQREEDRSGTVFSSVRLTPCRFHPGKLGTGREQRKEAQTSRSSQPHHGWGRSIREVKNKLHSGERLIGGQSKRKHFQATTKTPNHAQQINPTEERGIPTPPPQKQEHHNPHPAALAEGKGGNPPPWRQHSSHPPLQLKSIPKQARYFAHTSLLCS